ncbi:MAG TPA: hypothetical protein VKD72_17395, partial [Gemmataceae bacterium]|nr:hypothetical protein [Gemmataceae bacterium]
MIPTQNPKVGPAGRRWLLMTVLSVVVLLLTGTPAHASEADLAIPNLWEHGSFTILGQTISAGLLLLVGSAVICGTLGFSLYLRTQIHRLPAHSSMLNVANTIYETCKTYLIQQGKFLLMLFGLIAVAITFYLVFFGQEPSYRWTADEVAKFQQSGVPADLKQRLQALPTDEALDREEFLKKLSKQLS